MSINKALRSAKTSKKDLIMKRILALILTVASISLSLASCGLIDISNPASGKGQSKTYDTGYYKLTTTHGGQIQGGTVQMGEYPQTLKADGVTLGATPDKDGYYLGSDGERYAPLVANPHKDSTAGYEKGKTYYFKVEPILWDVVSASEDSYRIASRNILTARPFDDDSTSYVDSDIRAWLNGEFLETAFNDQETFGILVTEVDNSKRSVYSRGDDSVLREAIEKYAQNYEFTYDKIYLRSRSESIYGDGGDPTDYAVACGYCEQMWNKNVPIYCWTRTPTFSNVADYNVVLVTSGYANGYVPGEYILDSMGVFPCMRILPVNTDGEKK